MGVASEKSTAGVHEKPSTAPYNVLAVTHNYPPHVGGLEVVAQTEARGLARSGWRVKILTSTCGTDHRGSVTELDQGTEVVRKAAWNGFEKFGIPFPIFVPTLLVSAWRLVRWADLVHIHDTLYMSSWVTGLACRLQRRPYVVTKHVSFVPHPSLLVRVIQSVVHQLVGKHLLSRADAVYAINPAIEADVVALQQEIKPKTRGLLNGIDTERFRPAADAEEVGSTRAQYGLPTNRVLVLFAGRLVPKKRLSLLLDCRSPNYQIVIAGGGPQSEEELQSDNIYLGRLDQAQMAEIYRAVNIFVCPSISEFLPLTVLEASASGLPVVVEDDPNISASVLGERLVRVPDMEDNLSAILDQMATDPEILGQVNSQAVKVVHDYFSLETHLRTLESAYYEILRKNDDA